MLGQAQINENLTKKLVSNDKIWENFNSNLEGLTFSFENQLSLNKMFGTQPAHFAATIPAYDLKISQGNSKFHLKCQSGYHEGW